MTLIHTYGKPIKDLRDRAALTRLCNKILRDHGMENCACKVCARHTRAVEHAVMKTYEYVLSKQFRDSLIVSARPNLPEMSKEEDNLKSRAKA